MGLFFADFAGYAFVAVFAQMSNAETSKAGFLFLQKVYFLTMCNLGKLKTVIQT